MRTVTHAFAFAFALGVAAAPTMSLATSHTAATPEGAALSQGEVRKVDKDAGKVTIRHGPLANLDMPPMTMVFHVKDRTILDQLKAGDKIKFTAEKVDGAFTVTRIETAQ